MPFPNVLGVPKGKSRTFDVTMSAGTGGLSGIVATIFDDQFDGGDDAAAIWNAIMAAAGTNDDLIYIVCVVKGSTAYAYVGKTSQTLAKRYPKGPKGGLELVFDKHAPGASYMSCALYQSSQPAFVEGWCYQLLEKIKGLKLMNKIDPN